MCEAFGKYFSTYQIRHDILGFTDGEIKETDKQVSYERNVGIIPDPNVMAQEEEAEEAPPEGEEADWKVTWIYPVTQHRRFKHVGWWII